MLKGDPSHTRSRATSRGVVSRFTTENPRTPISWGKSTNDTRYPSTHFPFDKLGMKFRSGCQFKKEYPMKSKSVRFGRAIALSMLFFTTMFSIFPGGSNPTSNWNTVHIWAGSLLLIGSAVHLGTNLDWVKIVLSRPANTLKKRVLQNRRTDLGLFLSGLVCMVSGGLWLVTREMSTFAERWSNLHTISGLFMIVLLGIHLLLHWDWIVNTTRQLRNQQAPQADEQAAASSGS